MSQCTSGGGTSSTTAGQSTSDLPACDPAGASDPGAALPSELQGKWRFDDHTFEVGPNGEFIPNGARRIEYEFTADGHFTYSDFLSVTSDQLPTESGPCEQSTFNSSVGTARTSGATLQLFPTNGSAIEQAQACVENFLRRGGWCPSSPSEMAWSQTTDSLGNPALILEDLLQEETHVFARDTGE